LIGAITVKAIGKRYASRHGPVTALVCTIPPCSSWTATVALVSRSNPTDRCYDISQPDAMMPPVRTTVRIHDDLLRALKAEARRESISLTRLLDRVLRAGLRAAREPRRPRRRYREATHAMGRPTVPLDKALGLAATLEDAEVIRELQLRK